MFNWYDYRSAVQKDVRDYIEGNLEDILQEVGYDRDEDDINDFMIDIEEALNDAMFTDDSVTGNGSGSYWFNARAAEEAICHNFDLLEEACKEFGEDMGEILKQGAEIADVTIRCYLLPEAIAKELERGI